MKRYDVSRLPSMIELGFDGENNWRPNSFDCSALLKNHPDGVLSLWLLPQGESQAFPVALERDGDTVVWTPLNEEMTAEHGQLQIVVQDGTDVGKSKVIDYTVRDSLVGGADHPAETPSWAVQVVEDVADAVSHYPRVGDNGNWFVWDTTEGNWVDTGVAAGGGEISPEDIADAVADYLEEHPVEVTETDPTVPSWAKQPTKPTYTAQEVGALPSNTPIPSKTSDLTNDSGFLTQHQSLAAYRTASAQDTIDAAQDEAIGAKYSKPSGGIPKTDLASDVQTSLGKADTALQQHQSLSGYATETWVEGKGYQTAQQVQTAIAPLQPKAITDTGGYYTTDTVEGALQEIGAELASAGSASVPRIAKASTDTTATVEPNKLYVFPEMASLTITLAAITDNSIVNEYHFIFESGSTATTTTFPAIPGLDDFAAEANMAYEVSILEGRALVTSWEVSA